MFFDILTVLLYIVFVAASLILVIVILLQEGSGGGLAGAFGGAGSEAFGVKAGGINKFTAGLAGTFIVSAVCLGAMKGCGDSVVTDLPSASETPGDATLTPAEEDTPTPEGTDEDAEPDASSEGEGDPGSDGNTTDEEPPGNQE